jgi:hypothetical protein
MLDLCDVKQSIEANAALKEKSIFASKRVQNETLE